jgi:hypothetical protein
MRDLETNDDMKKKTKQLVTLKMVCWLDRPLTTQDKITLLVRQLQREAKTLFGRDFAMFIAAKGMCVFPEGDAVTVVVKERNQ